MHFQSVVFSGNPMILAGIGLKTQYLAPCLQPGLRHHKNLQKKNISPPITRRPLQPGAAPHQTNGIETNSFGKLCIADRK